MSEHDEETREQLGAYLLGACTPEEAERVEALMERSPAFRDEVASYAPVLDALHDVPAAELTPAPTLKRSIMDQVRQEATLFAAAGDEAVAGDGPATSASPAPSAPARGTVPADAPAAPGARRRSFLASLRGPRVAAVAAVLVALVVAIAVITGGGGDGDRPAREVTANVTAGQGSARVEVADDGGKLVVRGMPSPGAGKQYQVWLKTGSEDPRPSVVFDVDAKGDGTAELPDLADVDDVLVTAEPAGGSQTPTSQPVMQASV
ncbi:anti-sigma factor [Patulibacter sp. SYSU D01012]|uniref:anti-sigma factor domain-containing protein n=1 Tax=Patulibacter sp. SYSU D01012 TaxID=2817381 RepID=UPI001B308422|nr:anti-sigma factor [Patulibacter sp. SYSU D01012]